MREHLLAQERNSGRHVPELHPRPLPRFVRGLWRVFVELRNECDAGAISSAALVAWQRLHGTPLSPWEIDAIRRADVAWLSFNPKTYQPDQSSGRSP